MKTRDGHATINGDKTEYTMPSGSVDIISDDGRTLFSIDLGDDGSIRVSSGPVCKWKGVVVDDRPIIIPIASNCFYVKRPEYPVSQMKKGKK